MSAYKSTVPSSKILNDQKKICNLFALIILVNYTQESVGNIASESVCTTLARKTVVFKLWGGISIWQAWLEKSVANSLKK